VLATPRRRWWWGGGGSFERHEDEPFGVALPVQFDWVRGLLNRNGGILVIALRCAAVCLRRWRRRLCCTPRAFAARLAPLLHASRLCCTPRAFAARLAPLLYTPRCAPSSKAGTLCPTQRELTHT
jgi:hypothetical protein